ncbi:MAG: nitroreductase family protein [Alphaproteobacteria bacterium 32-64-14]|nr:MAG: nitroreductase family protein [Alphaproteobacteria bacterium 32-64-14]
MTVTEAVRQRISTRAFLQTPISQGDLSSLLETAQRSPSGGNLQPWKVIAVAGAAKDEIIAIAKRVLAADPMGGIPGDRPVYPDFKVIDPVYDARRRRVGEMMYDKIGIPKEDRAKRLMWFANNYRFFGAPVGLFMIIDKRMGHGQWAHMGMFMQTIALLAEERGWGTCMQECWARLRVELHDHFGLDDNHMVYAGMALGVPDPNDPVNGLYADRAPQGEIVQFKGF